MSTHIDTSDGTWREVSPDEWANDVGHDSLRVVGTGGGLRHYLRVDPVPALPTAAHTVIRVTWPEDGPQWPTDFVLTSGGWYPEDPYNGPPYDLAGQIASFEVLAEPRAVTAEAVLDRARAEASGDLVSISGLAREFGVES